MKRFIITTLVTFVILGAKGQGDFSFPAIPDSITQPEKRAAFLTLNYWNNLDLTSCEKVESDEVEQAFVDFLDVLLISDDRSRTEAIAEHVDKIVKGASDWRYYFGDLYEKYLDSPDSPMQNQELMITFLEALIKHPSLDKLEKIRPEYQMEMALKNRQGSIANNLKIKTIDDKETMLHSLPGAQHTMLLFYNPDCSSCAQQIAQAMDSPLFSDAVQGGKLNVVAIYPGNDTALWQASKSKIPENWTNAISQSPTHQFYDLATIPTIYLLDSHRQVVLKNTKIDKIIAHLHQ